MEIEQTSSSPSIVSCKRAFSENDNEEQRVGAIDIEGTGYGSSAKVSKLNVQDPRYLFPEEPVLFSKEMVVTKHPLGESQYTLEVGRIGFLNISTRKTRNRKN